MAMAIWNGEVLAESDDIEVVEGNVYFPADSVRPECLQATSHTTACPWKGEAKYYSVVAGGKTNDNAAWYYPEPKSAAQHIQGRIAFWKGVQVTR